MTLENYGIAPFNLSDEKERKKCFNWINLRPKSIKDDNNKCHKIDMRLYLLQQVKGTYFLKLNAQEEY